MVLMAAVIGVTLALTFHAFTPWVVLLVFLVSLGVLARFVPAAPSIGAGDVAGSLLALTAAGGWLIWNLPYAAQLLWVTRDPAIYTMLGIWLGDHQTVGVDVRDMVSLAQKVPELHSYLATFGAEPNGFAYSQGGVALPGLLGVGSWIGGIGGVFKANLFVGAGALVGLYAFARRFVGPWLALAVEAALGLAVAFLYLMRAPYSESVMLVGGLAGLVWFVAAVAERRVGLAVIAGVFLGTSAMARIDGPVALIGAGAVVVLLAVVVRRQDLTSMSRLSLAFLGGGLLSSLFGLLSIAVNHRRYLDDLRGEALLIWSAALASVAAGCAALAIRQILARRASEERRDGFSDRTLRLIGAVCGAAVPVLFAIWVSRPLWWHGHLIAIESANARAIESWQRLAGQSTDGTRSYDEYSVHWIAWYFGWGTVALAGIGLGLMLSRAIARRDGALLALVMPTGVAAMLYFNRVSVTPDQVWAYRRLLPIITPGILVGAMYCAGWWLRRGPGTLRRVVPAGLAAVLVASAPMLAWNSLLRVPEGDGALTLTKALCGRLTSPTVLLASGHAPGNIETTIRIACGRNVVSAPLTPSILGDTAREVPGLQVIAFAPEDLPRGKVLGQPSVVGRQRIWRHTLLGLPSGYDVATWQIWIGHVEDGRFIQDPR
jgi:hypothetical protein